MPSLTLHLVNWFLLRPQVFFFLFFLIFPRASFSLQLFISGTKAKCLAVSQIKGRLLPPRKSWNNKHGRRWNQPYLLLAPDSHICAAPLSVSYTAAAEAGEASAQCLPAPIACESPGKQLTGTQTANQMMDPTRRIRHDRGRWGCRSGHHWTWGRGADAVSCLSSVCVCVCVIVRMQICCRLCKCMLLNAHVCRWLFWHMQSSFFFFFLVFHSSHILHLDPKYFH